MIVAKLVPWNYLKQTLTNKKYSSIITSRGLDAITTKLVFAVQRETFAKDMSYLGEYGRIGSKSKLLAFHPLSRSRRDAWCYYRGKWCRLLWSGLPTHGFRNRLHGDQRCTSRVCNHINQ